MQDARLLFDFGPLQARHRRVTVILPAPHMHLHSAGRSPHLRSAQMGPTSPLRGRCAPLPNPGKETVQASPLPCQLGSRWLTGAESLAPANCPAGSSLSTNVCVTTVLRQPAPLSASRVDWVGWVDSAILALSTLSTLSTRVIRRVTADGSHALAPGLRPACRAPSEPCVVGGGDLPAVELD